MNDIVFKGKGLVSHHQFAVSWVSFAHLQELAAAGYFQCRIINGSVSHKIKSEYLIVTMLVPLLVLSMYSASVLLYLVIKKCQTKMWGKTFDFIVQDVREGNTSSFLFLIQQ